MSHTHFCDYAGHAWECQGEAMRPVAGRKEPSQCFCLKHQVPMEDGDHSRCSMELLACPEHLEAQLVSMGKATANQPTESGSTPKSSMFIDKDGKPTVGFCLWCDKDFYSMDEVEDHNAEELLNCPSYQRWKADPETFTE